MEAKIEKAGARKERPHALPRERTHYKSLLVANPNYFGNLPESSFPPVKKMAGNTTYEELECLGYNPALDLLEATVHIKLPSGFSGDLCSPGSTEYVRFYVDYGTGNGWQDVGLASFNSHDLPNMLDCTNQPDKPLSYVLTCPLNPEERNFCIFPQLPKVRGILSWDLQPPAGQPNWPPPWGNVIDRHIQVQPRPLLWIDVVNALPADTLEKLPDLSQVVVTEPFPLPGPGPVELAEMAKMYHPQAAVRTQSTAANSQVVPAHRFGAAAIQTALELGNQETYLQMAQQWQSLDLDLAKAAGALQELSGNVSYEELTCLGLEYNLDRLVATFKIKRPTGYSGDLCSAGSQEYVAFWVDWDNTCDWTYLNTVQVNVHDIATIPPDDLFYSAILPVDLNVFRQPCQKGPKIARIRAVLSWNVPPSTTNPNAPVHWGNRIDAHVQLHPGVPGEPGVPQISIIGGVGVADINVFGNGMTKPAATFALGGSPADPWLLGRGCPFGGLIIVQGPPTIGADYRLWARLQGQPLTEQVIKNPFHVVDWLGVGSWVTPNPVTGFVTYMNTLANFEQVLAHWTPPGDDTWEIRLEMTAGGPSIFTAWHTIQLDNTAPRRKPAAAPFEPPEVTCEIHIDSGGDCKDFTTSSVISGRFTARDVHFGGFSLQTLPSSMSPNAPTTAVPTTSQTATFASGGSAWQLDTTGMQPCGYVVLLQVWDRAIVNSQPGSHNYNYYDVGFCLRG